jgi:hypothetical protein
MKASLCYHNRQGRFTPVWQGVLGNRFIILGHAADVADDGIASHFARLIDVAAIVTMPGNAGTMT